MAEALNPYRQWLGLEWEPESGNSCPNHYLLLDLPPFEEDRLAIQAAADRALARVRSHRPGPHAAAWAQLLDQLSTAKFCLLDPDRKRVYDTQLRQEPVTLATEPADETPAAEIAPINQLPDLFPPGMAPRPASQPQAATTHGRRSETPVAKAASSPNQVSPAATHPESPARPARRHKATPPQPPGTSEPVDAGTDTALMGGSALEVSTPVPPAPVNAHVAPPRREPASILPMVAIIVTVLLAATLLIMFFAMRDSFAGSTSSPPPGNSQTIVPPASMVEQPAGNGSVIRRNPTHSAQTQLPSPAPRQLPGVTPAPHEETRDETVAAGGPRAGPDSVADPPPDPPAEPAIDTSPFITTTPGESESVPPATVEDTTAPVAAPPTPQQLAELSRSLQAARAALAQREFPAAEKQLAAAQMAAVTPEHKDLVNRLQTLAQYTQQFWQVVAAALQSVRAAEELTFDSGQLVVLVVETGPDWITVRREGRNERYALNKMPPGLALALAKRQLDPERAEDLLLLGACLATCEQPKPLYLEEARKYWLQAQAAGADVDDLLQTLTDSYQLAP